MNQAAIRALDIVISFVLLILGLPLFVIVLLLGYLDNGAPLFFQLRIGREQNPFTLIKFRTMKPDTESVGTHLVNSASITRLGSFLRKTKLDELPQLFNVLAGHMSLVGPRPCLPNQHELIDQRSERAVFRVRPGITGLAQINEIDMSTPRKLARYDRLMIERMTPGLYLRLLGATALGKGRGDRVKASVGYRNTANGRGRQD